MSKKDEVSQYLIQAGRDITQVGRDYVKHVHMNFSSGNYVVAFVSLIPSLAVCSVLGMVVTSIPKFIVSLPTSRSIASNASEPSHSSPVESQSKPESRVIKSEKVTLECRSNSNATVHNLELKPSPDCGIVTPAIIANNLSTAWYEIDSGKNSYLVTPGGGQYIVGDLKPVEVKEYTGLPSRRVALMCNDQKIVVWGLEFTPRCNSEGTFIEVRTAAPNAEPRILMTTNGKSIVLGNNAMRSAYVTSSDSVVSVGLEVEAKPDME
jgi:hypothetical protein